MKKETIYCCDCVFCDAEKERCMITDRQIRPTDTCQKAEKWGGKEQK